jgi:hypothetical protein
MVPLAAPLGRSERRVAAASYVSGLLMPGQRKSIEPMAARLGVDPQRLQQFIADSPWDEEQPLGFYRQGGRTRKPLGTRQAILPCLPFAKAHCNWSCVRSRALPSGAVIFGLQAITGATGTRTVAGPGNCGLCNPGGRSCISFSAEILNRVILARYAILPADYAGRECAPLASELIRFVSVNMCWRPRNPRRCGQRPEDVPRAGSDAATARICVCMKPVI